MSGTEQGIGGYVIVALITGLVVYSCTSNDKGSTAPPPAPAYVTPSPFAPSPTQAPVPVLAEPPTPKTTRRYDSAEGFTYYYSAAVTEDESKTGKVAPDMVAFWYLGRDFEGRDQIQRASADGSGRIANCARPCKVIHYSDGTVVGFDERSIIGAAFSDAQLGFLKKKPPPRPQSEPQPKPWTDYQSDIVVTRGDPERQQ